MSSMIAVTTTELDERQPLLHNPRSLSNEEEEISNTPSTSSSNASPPPTQRLLSLDVFRGLTVALMILVDDAGGAFPCINHSPWFGVTLADFVMPFFLFVVGVSISLALKKVSSKPLATKKVILRTIKLFLLGLVLQGGYFHGRHDLTYGIDVGKIRLMGVLQGFNSSLNHLIERVLTVTVSQQCSVNSPDYGPLPPSSPGWCLAPFDPEGILSSLMAAITCFLGLQFGHILVHFKGHMQRLCLWSVYSFIILFTGYVFELLGIPFCKPLYTLSYMCITAGASGLALTIIFYIVDVKHLRKPTMILQWMGMNALIIYALAACDLFPAAIQGFYLGSPENNMVDGTESLFQVMLHSKKWGTLVFVIVEILFWGLVAGFLHSKGIYARL